MEKESTSRDRRKSIRIRVAVPTTYLSFDSKGWVRELATSQSMDMSSGGIRLKTSFPLDVKEALQVNMGFRRRILTFQGEVVHVTPSEDQTLEVGIRIERIKDQDRIALARFVIRKCREEGFQDDVLPRGQKTNRRPANSDPTISS